MTTIKLHAFIAQRGWCSRRQAEVLISEGRVMVNGQPAHLGQRVTPGQDNVKIDGQLLEAATRYRYFLIDKPPGVISTTSDELSRPTVLSLLPKNLSERLYPVGRLDKDSEGLLLLTNDGRLTQYLTHPKHQVEKTYHALVAGRPTAKALDHLRRGVKLKEGYTQPAQVELLTTEQANTWLEISIAEGRHRQVRRMLERVGYETLRLIRLAMGPLDLELLEEKRVKELDAAEIAELFPELGSASPGDLATVSLVHPAGLPGQAGDPPKTPPKRS